MPLWAARATGRAEESSNGQVIAERQLRGAQRAFVPAFGIGHALGGGSAGGAEHRSPRQAGAIHTAAQALAASIQVFKKPRGYAGCFGGLGHRRHNAQDQPQVKRR